MKNQSLSRRAAGALLLSLALSGLAAVADDAAPVPVPAPRVIDATQTKALTGAIKDKNWDAARAAVQNGADVNIADKGGVTPLMRAADAGQTGLVQALLDAGAQANAVDKKGQSALFYAVPADPKKKKFGFGQVLGALGGNLGGNLTGEMGNFGSLLGGGNLDSLMGANLSSLLNGGAFNLGGQSGWTAIAGAALQGDSAGKFGIGQLLGGQNLGKLNAGGWTNLLSSVKGANPQILGAMGNLGAGGTAAQGALWSQFLGAASSGDQAGVAKLMANPDLAPLLKQAASGLSLAQGALPGNAARSIIGALVDKGAKADTVDRDGKTAAQLAADRGLTDLFGAQ